MGADAAFLTFYGHNGISPVAQDVADLQRHYDRRRYLYHHLGIPPFAIRDKRVLEFGCGTGHNSLYIASLSPAEYVLVDGNPASVNATKRTLGRYLGRCHVIESEILTFDPPTEFDLVICEGVIPHQPDPTSFARTVARHVAKHGVLVLTTADYVSVLSETLRRLIRDTLISCDAPLTEQLEVLRPVLGPHVAHLPGMSRSPDDWITDTIVNPWRNPLFSMSDAIMALDDDFEFLGSSPRFVADWRWYKDIHGEQANINQCAIEQHQANVLSLIDYRSTPRRFNEALAERIYELSAAIFWAMVAGETTGEFHWTDIRSHCREIASQMLALGAYETVASLNAVTEYFCRPFCHSQVSAPDRLTKFAPWFGRAQQYVSFVRR